MRVLVIEDNPKLNKALERGLKDQGLSVDATLSGHEGEEWAAVEDYDLVILDVMLPDHDGVKLCQNLRRMKVDTPILMLSALSATEDKVSGLNAGADDYLAKPFDIEELIARVHALLRRRGGGEAQVLRFDELELDLVKRRVTRAGEAIELTQKEFSFLEYLLRHPERVLSRSVIGEHVWDMNFDASSNVIDVYISMLRRKIDKPFGYPLIHTVIGAGYVLKVEPEAC